jgi:PAS domain S-box-containing protein
MHRFSDHFQEMHENQLKEHNRRLQKEVRASTAQLRESEAKYKTLVEEINDGYFVIQDEGIVFANRAYCEMHGYALHEVLGQRYYALVAPGSRQRVIEIYRGSHQAGGAPAVFEYMRHHKDGRTFPTEITAKVVRYEKRFSNIGLCRDISKRVEMERRMRESERMAYVGQITTSLSHEIRNPLSAVKLNLQILSRNPQLRGNDQRRIDISVKEVIRLEGILTELLDFAKPLQMEFAGCGVNRVLSSCAELLEMRFKEKGLSLVQKFDSRIPEIQGDGERLGQAFINLLLNAMEASPVGGKVWVKTQYYHRGPAQSIRIAFEDEGAGVPGETLDDIFKPFFTTKTRGTGLGLANVKRIVEAHGGRVKVGGRQSRGASFQVRLPVRREHG